MRHDPTIRDSILVHAAMFGLGDFYMSRLLLGALKEEFPGKRIVYAAPPRYLDALRCHPDVEAVDINPVVVPQWEQSYDISVMHGAWSSREYYSCHRPLQHPAEHMATRCGVVLPRDATMKFHLTEEENARGGEILSQFPSPVALLCPKSSRYDRNLSPDQLDGVANYAKKRGFTPVILHNDPFESGLPYLDGLSLREVMAVVNNAHHTVAVETSHHHLSGGLGRPTLACYSYCDGRVYSRYYPRCVVRQEHEGVELECNMARMPLKLIINGYEEMLDTYGDQ